MNLQKCENGHFYDADKFDSCPHCKEAGVETQDNLKTENTEKEEKSKSRFGFRKRKTSESKESSISNEKKGNDEMNESEENGTRYLNSGIEEKNMTTSLQMDVNRSIDEESAKQKNNNSRSLNDISQNYSQQRPQQVSQQYTQMPEERKESEMKNESSLQSAFRATQDPNDLDDGKTVGYFSCGSVEPPVGFLICIEGPDEGQYYELHSGNNYIGRAATMDVVIVNDKKVSREKHANVLYDPVGRNYMLLAGEAKGLTYFNEQLVLAPQVFVPNEHFKIGETKLMLVTVCSDKFSWDE
jgi:hypothetical protein